MIYCLIGLGVAAAGMTVWYSYWKSQARKFQTSGYTPPFTSCFGKVAFGLGARFLTYMTVGPVKVVNGHKAPRSGRVVFVGNHQLGCDFAMLRKGAGRYFKTLTAAKELKGFFGVVAAWMGIISIQFKEKSERAAAEEACVDAVTAANGSLGIFPEGNLLPDNLDLKERFLPGAVRIARAASENNDNASVQIVPMAIFYESDPKKAHWTHRFIKRSKWLGMRDPRNYDPIFKLDLDKLGSDEEREQVKQARTAKLKAYYHSHVTLYGGVVVVGDPIDVRTLPADPIEASALIRDRVHALLVEAQQV